MNETQVANDCCGNCIFWKLIDPPINDGDDGECRRHPPVIINHKKVVKKGADLPTRDDVSDFTRFPVVDYENWCGEHKRFGTQTDNRK